MSTLLTVCWPTVLLIGLTLLPNGRQAGAATWEQWQNSLKPKGKAGNGIALAVGGKTEYVIVIPASPTTQEQKAAEELQQWLGEMTGAEFAIVSDAEPPRDTEISVGRTSRLSAANLACF